MKKTCEQGGQQPFMAGNNEIEVIDLIDSDAEEERKKEIIELLSENEDEGIIVKDHDNISTTHSSYYQRAFVSILKSVLEVYSVILTEQEQSILSEIITVLSASARKMFIRLVLRKIGWHRCTKLVYEDIENVKEALKELQAKSLCVLDSTDLTDYLNLLTMAELKTVASTQLFLKTSAIASREELVRMILEAKTSGQQRISFSAGGKLASSATKLNSKLEILKQACGPIVKIREEIRQLIDTAISLYFLVSGSSQDNFSTAILVEINRKAYPKYKIIRNSPIFKCRQDFLEYQQALDLEISIKETEEHDEALINEVKANFAACLKSCNLEGSYFLRRYTAGWVYCRILSHFAASFESLKRYTEAVELYQILLNQHTICLGRRGKWWERLVLDTSKHLKNPSKALELCDAALADPWLRTSALTSIKRRQKKLKSKTEEDIDIESIEEPEVITLKGRIKGGNATGSKVKLHLNDDDLSLGTVEEFVLSEFSRDGWQGIHSESSCFTTLFALLFWDLLFEYDVPDVFQTAYQTAPLDLTTDAFHPLRSAELEARLNMIEEDFEAAINLLKKHHVTHHLVSCIGISWSEYSGETGIALLVQVARGIGPMALATILRQFCEDYRHNRSGMPDLILWRLNQSKSELVDHANDLIFAEVKSPNDRLSDAQRHWFSVLKSAGLRVIVVRVQDEEYSSGSVNKRLKS